jgi:hypothetical protein
MTGWLRYRRIEDVACRMVEFGQAGPIKPKDMLAFANRVYY